MKAKKGSKLKEDKSGETAKLKKRIRKLEKEKRELISEVKTMERVLEENLKFLKGSTEDVTVEDLIEAAKNKNTLKEVKESKECPKCGGELAIMDTLFGRLHSCKCGYRKKESK